MKNDAIDAAMSKFLRNLMSCSSRSSFCNIAKRSRHVRHVTSEFARLCNFETRHGVIPKKRMKIHRGEKLNMKMLCNSFCNIAKRSRRVRAKAYRHKNCHSG